MKLFKGDIGKLPPNDVALERIVLGSLMLEQKALTEVIDLLTVYSFYLPIHMTIFEAIKVLVANAQPVDIMTVTHQLRVNSKLTEAGGAYYIATLTNSIGSTANIEYHSRILVQHEVARLLILSADQILKNAYADNMDVFDLLEDSKKRLDKIESSIGERTGGLSSVSSVLRDVNTTYDASVILSREKGITGVETGFEIVNAKTAGWQKSDLIIIAGRPGSGKSSVAMAYALAASTAKVPIAFFSIEMSRVQLMNRLLSGFCQIEHDKIRRGELNEGEYIKFHTAQTYISNLPLYIDDSGSQSVSSIRNRSKNMMANGGLGLIIIDYLQKIQTPNSKGYSREQDVSDIAIGLKNLAKELNIPVIALAQLSRAVESRKEIHKRPMLSDLRDSGKIEEEADMVIMMYRPEYYGVYVDMYGNVIEEGNPNIFYGYTEQNIEKHRSGALGVMPLRFEEKFSSFYPLSEFLPNNPIIGNAIRNLSPNTGFDTKPADFQHEPRKTPPDEAPF